MSCCACGWPRSPPRRGGAGTLVSVAAGKATVEVKRPVVHYLVAVVVERLCPGGGTVPAKRGAGDGQAAGVITLFPLVVHGLQKQIPAAERHTPHIRVRYLRHELPPEVWREPHLVTLGPGERGALRPALRCECPEAVNEIVVYLLRRSRPAGLDNFHFHGLRRTFATRLRAANVHEYDIADLLSHSVPEGATRGTSVPRGYARAVPQRLRDAINALGRGKLLTFGRPSGNHRVGNEG
jgi:hypothetical protein